MCQLFKIRSAAMSGKLAAVFLVLIFCFAECAAGSCLSYGHSCWGAHGKRNGSPPRASIRERVVPVSGTRWLLSRLVQPPMEAQRWKTKSDFQSLKDDISDNQAFISDRQVDQDNSSDVQEISPGNDDEFVLEDPSTAGSRTNDNKFHIFKILKPDGN